MHPARKLAYDFVIPRILANYKVLDIGCGDAPLPEILANKGCTVLGVDKDVNKIANLKTIASRKSIIATQDVSVIPWSFASDKEYDAVTAIYMLQHLLNHECAVWSQIGRILKVGGKLLCTGRHSALAPYRESNRKDHLNAQNKAIVTAFGFASGLILEEYKIFKYDEHTFYESTYEEGNAFCALLRRESE